MSPPPSVASRLQVSGRWAGQLLSGAALLLAACADPASVDGSGGDPLRASAPAPREQVAGSAATVNWATITVGPPAAPTGSVSCSPASPSPSQTVTCTSSVTPVSGTAASTAWTFAFGTPSSAGTATATTSWGSAGTYTVQMTARNSYGVSATFSTTVTVIQPGPTTLFSYTAGDALGGATFSRASVATYVGADSVLRTATSGVARDGHYTPDGLRTLLIEPSATNNWTNSSALGGTSYTTARLTVSSPCTGTAPDGTSTACTLVPTSQNFVHSVGRATVGATSAGAFNRRSGVSFFVRPAGYGYVSVKWTDFSNTSTTATFNFGTTAAPICANALLSQGTAAAVATRTLRGGWCWVRLTFSNGAGGTTPSVLWTIGNSATPGAFAGDGTSGLMLWGMMFSGDNPDGGSYIPTTTATVTRQADALSWPITFAPQALTLLVEYDYAGSMLSPGAYEMSVIGTSANGLGLSSSGDPRSILVTHANTSGSVSASASAVTGGMVDAWSQLSGTGVVTADVQATTGSATPGTPSSALPLAGAWGSTTFWLGASSGGAQMPGLAVRKVRIVTGAQTLSAMRTY